MEMHRIRYFLAAAKIRNFTRAAEQCSVSPPSLLRAIKLLENEFGGPLFNREQANTHLTELGRLALPHLQLIYDEAAEVKKTARDYAANAKGTLSLGIMCTIAPHQFVELMQEFQKAIMAVAVRIMDSKASALEKVFCLANLMSLFIASLARHHMPARMHCRYFASVW